MLKREELSNPVSCMSRAPEDEFVFVLLSRDVATPATIRAWIEERIARGKNARTDAQIIEAEANAAPRIVGDTECGLLAASIVTRIVESAIRTQWMRHIEEAVSDLPVDSGDLLTEEELLRDALGLALGEDIGCLVEDEVDFRDQVDVLWVSDQLAAHVASKRPKWLCFHCGFGTSDEAEAQAHFGDRDDDSEFTPTCGWWMRMSKEERVAEFQNLLQELNGERDESARQAERIRELEVKNARLLALLNTPEVEDFDKAVPLEAAHQVLRWGADADAGKQPEDWFWLLGYLAGKGLAACKAGDTEKAKHHCISSAAALRNWHAHLRSGQSRMRPGISEDRANGDSKS